MAAVLASDGHRCTGQECSSAAHLCNLGEVEVDGLSRRHMRLWPPVVQVVRACKGLIHEEHGVEKLHLADDVAAEAELTEG
eukprot:scaffold129748_cov30-Tisochrysis_lutea.AAC.1